MASAARGSKDQPELRTRRTIVGTWLITMVVWFISEVLWCWRFSTERGAQTSAALSRLSIFCVLGVIWCFAGLALLIYWAIQAKKSGHPEGGRSIVQSELH